MNATRGLSTTLFLLGALSFLMPWLTLSCDGKPVESVTGSELVTGKKVGERGELERQTCATACLVSLIAGIVVAVAVRKPSNSGIANSLVALVAGAFALLTWWNLNQEVQADAREHGLGGGVAVEPALGMWLCLAGLTTIVLINLMALAAERGRSKTELRGVPPMDAPRQQRAQRAGRGREVASERGAR